MEVDLSGEELLHCSFEIARSIAIELVHLGYRRVSDDVSLVLHSPHLVVSKTSCVLVNLCACSLNFKDQTQQIKAAMLYFLN